jgi:WD40 repeat protein
LRLWDTRTWQEVALLAPEIDVKSAAFSPDGQHLATAGGDKVIIWNTSTHKPVASFAGGSGGLGSQDICFSPDGQILAYLEKMWDASVSLWDVKQGRKLGALSRGFWIMAIAFSPDGKYLVTGNGDKTANVWEVKARTPIVTLTNHTASVTGLAFSPAGDILATASKDQHIKLWNTTNWLEVDSLRGHRNEIWALAFSPDGRMLASGSKDETIRLWSSAARSKASTIRTLPTDAKWIVPSFNGRHWAAPYEDGTVGLWDSAALTERSGARPVSRDQAGGLGGVPRRPFHCPGTEDRKVYLRDPKSGQQVAKFDLGDLIPGSLSFSRRELVWRSWMQAAGRFSSGMSWRSAA